MRTLMLLVLTIVAVTGLQTAKNKVLLEIKREVETVLKQSSSEILNQFVKDVIPSAGCSEENLCQAARVMMNTHLKYSRLHRRLFAFSEVSHVTIFILSFCVKNQCYVLILSE
uniref:Interleukin 4 n=1 Tax=Cyprinus carpio TaxID=7962 RepID=A0A8C2C1E4_CYPCA